jgi:hypothetical protein
MLWRALCQEVHCLLQAHYRYDEHTAAACGAVMEVKGFWMQSVKTGMFPNVSIHWL